VSLKNFDAYSAYYDLLYRDKDYAGEVAFLDELIQAEQSGSKSILDLGCGTGIHDWLLAERGYAVHGIDRSSNMLERAAARAGAHPLAAKVPRFSQGDLTDFSVGSRFDVVVALFDVISYLTDYESLQAAFSNIKASLKPGGLLVFDCWYGPAVYTQRPGTRVRRMENEQIALTRIAEADFDCRRNRIDVRYEIFVKSKQHGEVEILSEVHPMRCYFDDELIHLLAGFGLVPRFAMQWFTKAPPSTESWSVLFGFVLDSDGN
jgi:SAM-dependent methyltransferase